MPYETEHTHGYTRMKPATRGLLVKNDNRTHPFFRGNSGRTCKALGPCTVTLADGTQYELRKTRKGTPRAAKIVPAAKIVKIRKRALRGPITDYLAIAERIGLNATNVANEYRYRRDNGYSLSTDVAIETNATFRGGDH